MKAFNTRSGWVRLGLVASVAAAIGIVRPALASQSLDEANIEKPITFTPIERSPAGIWLRPFVVLAKSPAEWVAKMDSVEATNELLLIAKIPPPDVDWSTQAVVIIGGGQARSVRVRNANRIGTRAILNVDDRLPLYPYNFLEVAPYQIIAVDRRALKTVECLFSTENEVLDEDFYADFYGKNGSAAPAIAWPDWVRSAMAKEGATQDLSWGSLKARYK